MTKIPYSGHAVCQKCGDGFIKTHAAQKYCMQCRDQHTDEVKESRRSASKRLYDRRRAEHLCVECGGVDGSTIAGAARCDVCRQKASERSALRTKLIAANGICAQCHTRKVEPGRATCKVCSRKSRERYKKQKEACACISCGKVDERTKQGYTRCKACAAIEATAAVDRYHRNADERRCPECGKDLPDGWFEVRCPDCKAKREAKRREVMKMRERGDLY